MPLVGSLLRVVVGARARRDAGCIGRGDAGAPIRDLGQLSLRYTGDAPRRQRVRYLAIVYGMRWIAVRMAAIERHESHVLRCCGEMLSSPERDDAGVAPVHDEHRAAELAHTCEVVVR